MVDKRHPDPNFAVLSGLVGEATEDQESQKDVDLGSIRALKPYGSDSALPPAEIVSKFKPGASVTVTGIFSWNIPQKKKPNFRQDI
eukprot:11258931-Heterocapsa_arctica.AAC.1